MCISSFSICDRKFGGIYRRTNLVIKQKRNCFSGRLRKNKNGFAHACFTQLNALIHRSNTKIACSCTAGRLRYLQRSMTIGISLDHRHKTAAIREETLCLHYVVLNSASINFHPRPSTIALIDGSKFFFGGSISYIAWTRSVRTGILIVG